LIKLFVSDLRASIIEIKVSDLRASIIAYVYDPSAKIDKDCLVDSI
jgi:hypothetical protein